MEELETEIEDEQHHEELLGEDNEEVKEDEQEHEIRAETEDALAEAEIYLAYGRSDAAIELLTRALTDEPERSDLRLKLMEILRRRGRGAGVPYSFRSS